MTRCSFCEAEGEMLLHGVRSSAVCRACVEMAGTLPDREGSTVVAAGGRCTFCRRAIGTKRGLRRFVAKMREVIDLQRRSLLTHPRLLLDVCNHGLFLLWRMKKVEVAGHKGGVVLCTQCLDSGRMMIEVTAASRVSECVLVSGGTR